MTKVNTNVGPVSRDPTGRFSFSHEALTRSTFLQTSFNSESNRFLSLATVRWKSRVAGGKVSRILSNENIEILIRRRVKIVSTETSRGRDQSSPVELSRNSQRISRKRSLGRHVERVFLVRHLSNGFGPATTGSRCVVSTEERKNLLTG